MKLLSAKEALCLSFFWFAGSSAQTGIPAQQWLEVRPASSGLVESGPQNIVTVAFRITNYAEKQDFIAEIDLPAGWREITNEVPFSLDRDESEIKLVSFFVPVATLAGTYSVGCRVHSRMAPEISDRFAVQVVVYSVSKLEVRLLDAPGQVVAGDVFAARFAVSNRGNRNETVVLSAESSHRLDSRIDTAQFILGPGGSRETVVTVQTDGKASELVHHGLVLKAGTLSGDPAGTSADSWVEIVPRVIAGADPYHRIPVTLALGFAGQADETSRSGFVGDIRGGGPLDESGHHILDFRFRGPDAYNLSLFAEHDEYYLRYTSKSFFTHLGDNVFSLSPLTETGSFGRGIEAALHLNRVSVGGFYQKSRWLYPSREEMASFLRVRKDAAHWLGFNFLRKETRTGYGQVLSLEGRFEWRAGHRAELETALSSGAGEDRGYGWRALASGNGRRFSYFLHWIYADPDFIGYYRSTNYVTANATLALVKNLILFAGAQCERQNLDSDTARSISPYSDQIRAGIQYQVKRGSGLSLEWNRRSSEDRLPDPKFDYREWTLQWKANHSFGKLNLSAGIEAGKTWNELSGDAGPMRRYTANVLFAPDQSHFVGAYVYYDENVRVELDRRRRLTVGLNASLRFGRKTDLTFTFQNSYALEEYYRDRNILELQYRQVLPWNHQLLLRGRYTLLRKTLNRSETVYLASYTLPIGVPAGRKKAEGQIKGIVYNEENGLGVAGVVLSLNGLKTVSNRKGAFVFPSLKPGNYHLGMGKTNVGFGAVSAQKIPVEIDLEKGRTFEVRLGITKACHVTGTVSRCEPASVASHGQEGGEGHSELYFVSGNGLKARQAGTDPPAFVPVQGLKSFLVEMEKDGELLRQLTDEEGKFIFDELRPGRWLLRLYGNLPEYHYFEQETYELELKPGESCDLAARVLPKKRSIRMIEDGGELRETLGMPAEPGNTEKNDQDKKNSEKAVVARGGSTVRPAGEADPPAEEEKQRKEDLSSDAGVHETALPEAALRSYGTEASGHQPDEPVTPDPWKTVTAETRVAVSEAAVAYDGAGTPGIGTFEYQKGNLEEVLSRIPGMEEEDMGETLEVFLKNVHALQSAMEKSGGKVEKLRREAHKSRSLQETVNGRQVETILNPPTDTSGFDPVGFLESYRNGLTLYYRREYGEALHLFSALLSCDIGRQLAGKCQRWIEECERALGEGRGILKNKNGHASNSALQSEKSRLSAGPADVYAVLFGREIIQGGNAEDPVILLGRFENLRLGPAGVK